MRLLYFITLFPVVLFACKTKTETAQAASSAAPEKDTIFVPVNVSRDNLESLEQLFGKFLTPENKSILDQAPGSHARVTMMVPLLATSWVNDFEDVFNTSEEEALDSLIGNYENKTSNQFAVVTIDSNWVSRQQFDSLVLKIHKTWGVGQPTKNNGIVIGISKGYRIMRISNGYGIEKIISDEETKAIIDQKMIPAFQEELYYEGTKKGIVALMAKLDSL
jgi:uncharacterized membrane protein YgcG